MFKFFFNIRDDKNKFTKTFSFQDNNIQRKEFEDFEKRMDDKLNQGLKRITSRLKMKKKEINKKKTQEISDYYKHKENAYQEKFTNFIKDHKQKEDG